MTYFDVKPGEPNSIVGEFTGPWDGTHVDLVVVMSHPAKFRVQSLKPAVVGEKSIELINGLFDYEPVVYWTYAVKTPITSKKVPVGKIRKDYPFLLQELEFVFGMSDTTPRILTQGNVPSSLLATGFKTISDDHGGLFQNETFGTIVVPTFEFYKLGRGGSIVKWIKNDLNRMMTLPDPVKPLIHDFEQNYPNTKQGIVFLDIETTGLNFFEDDITSIGVSFNKEDEVYVLENPTPSELDGLFVLLGNCADLVVGHNLSFDLGMLQRKHPQRDWSSLNLADTMYMAFGLAEFPRGLKHLTSLHTDRPGPHAFGSFADAAYLAEDVLSTRDLYYHYLSEYDNKPTMAAELLNKAVGVFVRMRFQGVGLDRDIFDDVFPEFVKLVTDAEAVLEPYIDKYLSTQPDLDEFNPRSPKQMAGLLLFHGVPLTKKTDKGAISVSEPTLEEFRDSHKLVRALLDFRYHTKQLSFLENYEGFLKYDAYLHPRLKLDGADTGRLSCKDPNLQQVPRVGKIKTMFISKFTNGLFGLVDLDRAELITAALLANDKKFAEALLSEDVHRYVASMIYKKPPEEVSKAERKASKSITFGLLYGGSDQGLAFRSGLDPRVVTQVRKEFLDTFKGISAFLEYTKTNSLATGYVYSPTGRRRDIGQLAHEEGPERAGRAAINTPIQGTASDVMLWILVHSAIKLKEQGFKSHPIFGVHDSAMFDIHPDEVEDVARVIDEAFKSIVETPLSEYELYGTLNFTGTLYVSQNWAGVEDTNEYFDKDCLTFACSS